MQTFGTPSSNSSHINVEPKARPLRCDDIEQLMELEQEKWDDDQAASATDMLHRIRWFPQLSIGAFCPRSGRVLASLFLKPITPDFWRHQQSWRDCVDSAAHFSTRSLFGISLSGRDDGGVQALDAFLWPHLAAAGWQEVSLGSPIPGWAAWHESHSADSVHQYVMRRRADGLPCDPQLRYYHHYGFREVLDIKADYFPHRRSQGHGVILRREVHVPQATETSRELSSALQG